MTASPSPGPYPEAMRLPEGLHDLTTQEVADLWSELEDARRARNGFGGDVAEIYAYRLLPANLRTMRVNLPDPDRREEQGRRAAKNLEQILRCFAEAHPAHEISVDDRPWSEGVVPFWWRVHIRVEPRRAVQESDQGRRAESVDGSWRGARQARVFAWCEDAFGIEKTTSLPHRGLRLLEEVLEVFQAAGGLQSQAHALVDHVFSQPAGDLRQELGGVGVGVLALAAAAGLSADEYERREVARVLAKPPEHFRRRDEAKDTAGFLATSRQGNDERGGGR